MKKTEKSTKKLGRDVAVQPEELLKRFGAIKEFLEDNWCRIGKDLQRVRQPEKVRHILTRVPDAKWLRVFRDYRTGCLLNEGINKVHWKDLRLTKEQSDLAVEEVDDLWPKFHHASRVSREATTALMDVISQFGSSLLYFPFFFTAAAFAKQLDVGGAKEEFDRISESLQEATSNKKALIDRLSSQEAWYARNEIVKFVKTPRFEKTPINFAKAMSGLPDCSWISSHRQCSSILDGHPLSRPTPKYQLLDLLRVVVKKVKPINWNKIEAMTRDALLEQEPADPLRLFVSPRWADLKQSFLDCVGKGIHRTKLPEEIMARFLHHQERSKTQAEMTLAAREKLI